MTCLAGPFGRLLHNPNYPNQNPTDRFRCKLPNVDPQTGIRHKVEPDRALRKFRDVDEGAPKMGCMGMQLCPVFPNAKSGDEPDAYIEVGMSIDVVKRGSHLYIKQ